MTEQFTFGGEIIWRPTSDHIEQANLTAFMRLHGIRDFDELMQKSTSDVAWFTDAVLKFLDVQFYEPYSKVVDLSDGIQFPKWCVDGRMNIVHNCVDKYQVSAASGHAKRAVVFEGEEGITKTFTYEELYKEVNKTANALRSLGLGKGDAIGIFMPMTPEIVIALLAIAKIGGIILPLFSGYGAGAIVSRLADANAKALFAAGAVHTHCGFPVKAAQDMAFGTDVHAGDVIYWMTDMGWMMGPWQVFGSLLLGATMFLYDGAPDFPAPDRLWELVEKHGINQMGVSPTLIRSLIPQGDEHFKKHDLSSLKCFASTGEPWNPDPWMWLFEKVGEESARSLIIQAAPKFQAES
ncbi:AMP-binding protein [Candidatus Villigracilis affinis]|uniref:AMP-binding protein n=1 Tax=Candidatus Villigracilis affinis TaxID=3140682 RepID=UPI0031E6C526